MPRGSRVFADTEAGVATGQRLPGTRLRVVEVLFEVTERLYPLRWPAATILGEDLRRRAAGQFGEHGVEGARAIADAIERVLVGESETRIVLAGDGAEAVFYALDVSLDPRDPDQAEESDLYQGVRELHKARLADAQGSAQNDIP
jgi:hypothetical protein